MLDAAYDGAAPHLWTSMSLFIAAGAMIMALSLVAYVLVLVASAVGVSGQKYSAPSESPRLEVGGVVTAQSAWTAPIAVAVLVVGMYAATLAAFAILHALPLTAGIAAGAH